MCGVVWCVCGCMCGEDVRLVCVGVCFWSMFDVCVVIVCVFVVCVISVGVGVCVLCA